MYVKGGVMDPATSLGRWIKHRRRVLLLTQEELATQIGCAAITLRKIEADERRLSIQMAERLADAFALPSDERVAFLRTVQQLLLHDPVHWGPQSTHRSPAGIPQKMRPTRPRNLPNYTSPLLGRETELSEVITLLGQPDVRLLTLTGVGGTGKTRLAVQAASALLEQFTDGVVFVDLTPIHDAALVAAAIAQVLELTEQPTEPLHQRIIAALKSKDMLMVLDNFEHVLQASGLIAELLRGCTTLKVLVTSRALLCLSGEYEFAVPPLSLPQAPATELVSLDQVRASPAVELFVQRAQAITRHLALTETNLRLIAEICTRLDGLPLAIELAAARSKLLTPRALLARLEHRLAVLTGGARDLPPRQHSLRLAIDWSHNLLSPAEQMLFRQLSVFVGGGRLSAIEAICTYAKESPLDQLPVVDILSSLVNQSLVQCMVGSDGELRFVLLETIREYTLEQLEAAGESAKLRQRHAIYYAGLATAVAAQIDGGQATDWVPWVSTEHANLCVALQWALDRGDGITALHLCCGIYMFWTMRGMQREGLVWVEAALAIGGEVPPQMMVSAFWVAGMFAYLCGEYERAINYTDQALSLARDQGNQHKIADCLHNLGAITHTQGHIAQAKAYYAESLSVQQQIARPFGLTLSNLGLIALEEYDDQNAMLLLTQALELAQRSGDIRVTVTILNNLVLLHLFASNTVAAIPLLVQALHGCQQLGGLDGACFLLAHAAAVGAFHGELTDAVRLFAAAEALDQNAWQRALPRALAYDKAVQEWLRMQLAPDVFEAAQAEGRAMTLEQSVVFALRVVGETPAHSARCGE